MLGKKFFYISLSLFLCCWFLLSSQGLRGSDHYWYWAAVRSIVELGEFTSNTVFPASAFSENYLGSPFIHNIPQVYLASLPSFIFGYKWGWSVFNLLCILGGFYFLFKILLVLGFKREKALFTLSLWMLVPINVWMSFQPNSEAFVSLLVVLSTYLLILIYNKHSSKLFFWLIIILTMLVVTRINFLVLIVLLPMLFFPKGKKKVIIYTIIFSGVVLSGIFISQKFFPSASKGAVTEALNMSQENPYAAPMLGFYNTEQPKFDVNNFISSVPTRIYNVFHVQLFNRFNFIFYSVYNLITLTLLGFVFIKKSFYQENKFLLNLYFLLLITHLSTAFVFQNQFRYLFTILPVSVFIFYFLIEQLELVSKLTMKVNFGKILTIGMIVFFAASSFLFIRKVKAEAVEHSTLISELQGFVKKNDIKENDNVFLVKQSALYSFVLFPRKVLSFDKNLPPKCDDQLLMLDNISPSLLLNNSNFDSKELKKTFCFNLVFTDSSINNSFTAFYIK